MFAAEAPPSILPLPPPPTASSWPFDGFKIRQSGTKGFGAFATRQFTRGDLNFAEKPLVILALLVPVPVLQATVKAISPEEQEQFYALHNSSEGTPGYPRELGIVDTNCYNLDDTSAGILVVASRFNHSCSPNARNSWDSKTEKERIFCLRTIAVGEEIQVSYLAARNVYGSTRAERRARLEETRHFICGCSS